MDKRGVKFFSRNSDKKEDPCGSSSTQSGTYKWINVLDELVSNYNAAQQSTILTKLA